MDTPRADFSVAQEQLDNSAVQREVPVYVYALWVKCVEREKINNIDLFCSLLEDGIREKSPGLCYYTLTVDVTMSIFNDKEKLVFSVYRKTAIEPTLTKIRSQFEN